MAQNTIDLSKMTPDAIKASVFKTTALNPIVVYTFFGGLAIASAWAILPFVTHMLVLAAGIFFIIFGPCFWAYNYFLQFEQHRFKYFRKLREENEIAAKRKLLLVQEYLDEREWDQAASQIDKLQAKMEAFDRVLKSKFEEGEMAFTRYHSVAEQVFLNALENLENMKTQLESIDTIDPDYIQHRCDELYKIAEQNDGYTDAQMEERETLEQRWNLREEALQDVEKLLSQNEKAMTELDNIASKIARSKTDGRDNEAILRESIDKLNQMGAEAQKNWG